MTINYDANWKDLQDYVEIQNETPVEDDEYNEYDSVDNLSWFVP